MRPHSQSAARRAPPINPQNFDFLRPFVQNLVIRWTPSHIRAVPVCASLRVGSLQHSELNFRRFAARKSAIISRSPRDWVNPMCALSELGSPFQPTEVFLRPAVQKAMITSTSLNFRADPVKVLLGRGFVFSPSHFNFLRPSVRKSAIGSTCLAVSGRPWKSMIRTTPWIFLPTCYAAHDDRSPSWTHQMSTL